MASNVKGKTTLSPRESASLMLGRHAMWNPGNVHLSQCHLEWLLSHFVGVLWINKQCHMAAENNSNIPLEGRLPINPSPFISKTEWDTTICEIYRPVNSPGKQQCVYVCVCVCVCIYIYFFLIYIYMEGGLLKFYASSIRPPSLLRLDF